VIRGAADGEREQRDAFADRYEDVVRAYLAARWRGSPLVQEIDDAIQEVFVESFRAGGVLSRARPEYPGGFRAFFYGVIRNVALRHETRQARRRDRQADTGVFEGSAEDREERLTRIFDRTWARTIMREAAARQEALAAGRSEEVRRRVELLRLRFGEGLPIREIARLWEADPTRLHREYARARKEFREVLAEVVAFHHPGSEEAVQQECTQLLGLLG
jgi:RNA polymerase sigma-70 factor (ECF subfamily)